MEIWKTIPDFCFYEVSNLGRVRSISRIIAQKQPRYGNMIIERHFKSKILSPCKLSEKGKNPHYTVTICRDALKYKFLVHRLVLLAFIGECPAGMECCHNDGNGLNNNLDNLRWDTPSNNQLDRHKHGTHWSPHYIGSTHPRALLNENKIIEIRKMHSNGILLRKIAEYYKVKISTIRNVIKRKTWKHV